MAEFYVEKIAQDNGAHFVHKANCEHLPGKDSIQYLGAISNPVSAIKKASGFFRLASGCPHCAAV